MRHAHTQALHAYWLSRRNSGTTPLRSAIAPQELSDFLGHVFILRRMDRDHHVFRLAGTQLCDLFQREFRDQNFLSLWRGYDRNHMQALLDSVLAGGSPAYARIAAHTLEMQALPLELALFPLRGAEGSVDRTLGLLQPLHASDDLGGRPLVRLRLKDITPPVLTSGPFAALNGDRHPFDEGLTGHA